MTVSNTRIGDQSLIINTRGTTVRDIATSIDLFPTSMADGTVVVILRTSTIKMAILMDMVPLRSFTTTIIMITLEVVGGVRIKEGPHRFMNHLAVRETAPYVDLVVKQR